MTVNPYQPPQAEIELLAEPALQPYAGYVPGGGRATAAIVTLYVSLGAALLNIATGVQRIHVLGAIQSGSFSMPEVEQSDYLCSGTAILQLLALIACAVAFCLWFHRAYTNLRPLGAHQSFEPGWAPGSFFVPFLNLYRPYQIAKEIWLGSGPLDDHEGSGHGAVSLWWGLFIGGNILANIGGRVGADESIEALQVSTYILLASDLVTVGAALAAIQVIKGIERRQLERHAALRASGQAAQAG